MARPGFRFSAARPRRRHFETEANQAYGLTPAEGQPLNSWKKGDFETTGLVQRFARLLGGPAAFTAAATSDSSASRHAATRSK
jgi:hypothetical protein